ncbi:MAG: hypothetical protein K2V38_28205 [Gemmataceae bacterium]|nr:hypothetical protein [Gemmataceae bacterium]
MTLSGAEHPAKSIEKTHFATPGGAESGALARIDLDPDLSRIVAAWPDLPAPIKAAILALVGTVEPRPDPTPGL